MRAGLCAALLAAVSAGGCVSRAKLGEGELERFWYLQPDVWAEAQAKTATVGGRKLPTRWVFRQEPGLLWSTVSIVRAVDKLKAGTNEVEIAISLAHARMLAQSLSQARQALLDLKAIADPDDPPTPQRWSQAAAAALITVEKVARLASEPVGRGQQADPLAWSAGPVLQMAVQYLNERTSGSLLAGMGAGEVNTLREVLAQVVLRLAFAVADRREPPALRQRISAAMASASRPEQLRKSLPQDLLAELPQAPPAGQADQLRAALRAVLAGAPAMLRLLESFVQQWERMDWLGMELRRLGEESIVAVTVKTKPGREVRLAKLHWAAPAIVFRGGSRIMLLPAVEQTGETAVLFEPVEGGATEVRFEGPAYWLVRLAGLPLADAALREIRLATARPQRGWRMVSVIMLMQAKGASGDPRRLIGFQDVRQQRILRGPFEVRAETTVTEQAFSYVTPTHRYGYRRVKAAGK